MKKLYGVALTAMLAVPIVAVTSLCGAYTMSPGPKVSQYLNKHNLSGAKFGAIEATALAPGTVIPSIDPASGTSRDPSITYRATYDSANPANNRGGLQICIFCHTPHNASSATQQAPLWNRKFSGQTFQRFSSATLQIRSISGAQYGVGTQPDGSSKLCLSCHDGVSRLGDTISAQITMYTSGGGAGGDYITGLASFDPTKNNKMKTGHHPVSFVYTGGVQQQISSGRMALGLGGVRLPTGAAAASVKLDRNSKMQCTTCHNPHQNQSWDDACYNNSNGQVPCSDVTSTGRKIVPFWTYHSDSDPTKDHDAVCNACHNMTALP